MAVARLRSRIPQIMGELEPKMLEGIRDAAETIAEGAKERVPVQTGALRDAIHVESFGNEIRVVAGDSTAWYGHIIEHGSVFAPARPFLIPALEAERSRLADIIGESLDDL